MLVRDEQRHKKNLCYVAGVEAGRAKIRCSNLLRLYNRENYGGVRG